MQITVANLTLDFNLTESHPMYILELGLSFMNYFTIFGLNSNVSVFLAFSKLIFTSLLNFYEFINSLTSFNPSFFPYTL